jgi:hypothetical protein
MRTPILATLTLLAACSSGSQSAGTATPAPASATTTAASGRCPLEVGTRVLSTEFTSAGERARITLQAGCVYWATTDVGGVTLQLRPRTSGTQLPYLGQLMSAGVQGGSTWEIRATIDGEYDIWATFSRNVRAVKLEVTVRGSTQPAPN